MDLPALRNITGPPSNVSLRERYVRLERWSEFYGFRAPTTADLAGLKTITGLDERELSCLLCYMSNTDKY